MAKKVSGSGNRSAAIRGRLARIVAEHSLSKVAQRTGAPVSSVHRYVHGGRIPADFCAALAEGFAVNPAWLLNGQGAPYATDVGSTGTVLASGMREVVAAMNEASRLRLGSLAGRRDLALLRELADASARHQQLRGRVTREVEPVIRDWLAQLRNALNRFDLDRAADLESALERLLQFTDDAGLRRDLDRCRAQSAYIQGRRADAVTLQRRNLMLQLADGNELREPELRECFNLCVALSGLGRSLEGRAVAQATLALRGPNQPDTPNSLLVQSMLAAFELSLGNASACLALLQQIFPRRNAHSAPNIELVQVMALLRVQGLSPRAVLADGIAGLPVLLDVLRAALAREDAADIDAALKRIREAGAPSLRGAAVLTDHAKWVLKALRRRGGKPLAAPPHTDAPAAGLEALDAAVLRTQSLRLAKDARWPRAALHAHRLLADLPIGVQPDALVVYLHARNLLATQTADRGLEQARQDARDRISVYLAQGFALFRAVA